MSFAEAYNRDVAKRASQSADSSEINEKELRLRFETVLEAERQEVKSEAIALCRKYPEAIKNKRIYRLLLSKSLADLDKPLEQIAEDQDTDASLLKVILAEAGATEEEQRRQEMKEITSMFLEKFATMPSSKWQKVAQSIREREGEQE